MGYKLVPRFYYTLPLFSYLKFRSLKTENFTKQRISFNAARTSLRLLLSSISKSTLKIGVQAYTCHTVFQSITKAGHIPVFLDIDTNFHLDLIDLQRKIETIDVLIITHTFGFPEQIDKIKKIAGKTIIIEDCAHSFMSKSNGLYTGTLLDASIFSTGLAKFPAVGAGGFCLINNAEQFPYFDYEYNKLKQINLMSASISFFKTILFTVLMKSPVYGVITYKLGKKLDTKLDFIDKFSFKEYLPMKWVIRVFNANFNNFEKMQIKQKTNAEYLSSLLKNDINSVSYNLEDAPNFYAFPILMEKREPLFDELIGHNIEAGKHFAKSLFWAQEFGYKQGVCPQTEKIINQIITLPIHNGVSKSTIIKMAEIVNRYD